MKKFKFYCPNCGWETMLEEDYLEQGERCSLCGKILVLDEDSLDNLIAEDIEREQLETMRENIQRRGNDATWYAIENNIDNPYTRMMLRGQFFRARGHCPEKENYEQI